MSNAIGKSDVAPPEAESPRRHPQLPWLGIGRRRRNAVMHVIGGSDRLIVPRKSMNNDSVAANRVVAGAKAEAMRCEGSLSAESMEGRGLTEENIRPSPLGRTQRKSEIIFYVQLRNGADVLAAREAADAAGLYGTRIYVEQGDPSRIHLADAVVILPEASDVPESEMRRVVNPTGVALAGGRVMTKPFPEGLEDWTHPLHGPDNNPQSWDRLARAPYHTQFLAKPNHAPMPQVAVTSAGRVFKAFGHIAPQRQIAPWVNKLVASNGYSGTILWKRDLMPGYIRNTFIATPKTLYVGDGESCNRIDTATGALKGAEILDDVAKAISKHKGKLNLSGLKSLSPEAAKTLAGHEGQLKLDGLQNLSPQADKALLANPLL